MTILFFFIIAIMRVIQTFCGKITSNLIHTKTLFFQYGVWYQIISSVLGLIALCFSGFYGFDLPTVLCALAAAVLFAVDLYAGIECMKGGTLVLATMFANGGLFIPCIVGIFLFDEQMSLFQWGGLILFIVSACLLVSGSKDVYHGCSFRTVVMLIIHMLANGLIMVVQKVFGLMVPDSNPSMYSFLTFGFHAVIMAIGLFFVIASEKHAKKRALVSFVQEPAASGVGCVADSHAAEEPATALSPTAEEPAADLRGNTIARRSVSRDMKIILLCGALLAVALFTINLLVLLMVDIPSVVLFTISSAISVIITCLVGAIGFHEKLTIKNLLGLVLGFASIIIISLL